MFTLIRNADIYAPQPLGVQDIFIANGVIAAIGEKLDVRIAGVEIAEYDLEGRKVIPGLMDNHVHITGGGGEGGFATRTPEIQLSSITTSGVTTVFGLLGTDGTTRSMPNLLAKACALEEEGITTYIYSGAYQVPTPTLTGCIRDDIILIHKVIGAGEIAISDHRSSQPRYSLYRDIVAQARVGGMLSNKAGVVDFHVGDGKRGLEPLRRIIANSEIPYTNMLPTHINRIGHLLDDAIAYAKEGGYVDITSGVSPEAGSQAAIKPSQAIARLLAEGVPADHILMSSDGNGSMPVFDEKGNNIGVGVADQKTLLTELRDAVLDEGCDLETVLPVVTSNVARLFKLPQKGEIRVGADADLAVLCSKWKLKKLWAKGRLMVDDGEPIVFGTYEKLKR